jgi:carboxylesterase
MTGSSTPLAPAAFSYPGHGPALVFTSDAGTVIPPSSLKLFRKRLGSRELDVVCLPGGGHVATLDVDAPLIFEQSLRFFLQHAASLPPSTASSEFL